MEESIGDQINMKHWTDWRAAHTLVKMTILYIFTHVDHADNINKQIRCNRGFMCSPLRARSFRQIQIEL